jgi:putative hydrolase of the HAD superfamily
LDDTLHEFRLASSNASEAVFTIIVQKHSDLDLTVGILKTAYNHILKQNTANAFTDKKTSTQYRRERFAALLRGQSIVPNDEFLDELAARYQSALKSALRLKPGAIEVLQHLRSQKKKILIITEGPRDAQEWTIEQLGLKEYVDILVTSSEVGKSKVDGLFEHVLSRYHIKPEEMIFVGDNVVRDVWAAEKAGILSVLFDENWDGREREDGVTCITALKDIVRG